MGIRRVFANASSAVVALLQSIKIVTKSKLTRGGHVGRCGAQCVRNACDSHNVAFALNGICAEMDSHWTVHERDNTTMRKDKISSDGYSTASSYGRRIESMSFGDEAYSPAPSSRTAALTMLSPKSFYSAPFHMSPAFATDDFVPIRIIGKGGQGTVYLVKDLVTERILSLKVVSKTDIPLRHYSRIFSEQHIMRKISGLPHILPLWGSFHDNDNFYFMTKYASNGDLLDMVDCCGTLAPPAVLHYSAQLVLGLYMLHHQNIIHHDIKLDNLLVDESGNLMLADFGVADMLGKSGSFPWKATNRNGDHDLHDHTVYNLSSSPGEDIAEEVKGSKGYVAPEVYCGRQYSLKADIWAAGVCIYAMLMGTLPFGMSTSQTNEELLDRSSGYPLVFDSHVDADTRDLLDWMLNKDSDERPDIEDVMSHACFESIDWVALASGGAGSESTAVDMGDVQWDDVSIPAGKPYRPGDDPYPWFTWVSPFLQPPEPHDGLPSSGQ